MSQLLSSAFTLATKYASRKQQCYIERVGVFAKTPITLATSNYHTDKAVLDNVNVSGHEFVIPKASLDGTPYTQVERTDVLHDPELGTLTIESSKPLFALGVLVGWRVRTG